MNIKTAMGNILKQKPSYFSAEELLNVYFVNKKYNFPNVLMDIISRRIKSIESIEKFVNPSLKNSMKAPLSLLDFNEAVNIIYQAILNKKEIVIFGDYDVDGTTSIAMFVRFLQSINYNNFQFFVPNRATHGYGLTFSAIEDMKLNRDSLFITLDCGTTSLAEISHLKDSFEIEVVVIDHHKSGENLPKALIVNPNRADCVNLEVDLDFKQLSAAGVLFFVLLYLNRRLGNGDAAVLHLLQLVAVSTICDVMPLTGMNRAICAYGLNGINTNPLPALHVMKQELSIDKVSSYDIGFKIGPMINASGRISDAFSAVKMLISEDELEILPLVKSLKVMNEDRKEIECQILLEIEEQSALIEKQLQENGFLLLYKETWHEGLVGIISSRLKDKYTRLSIVGFLKNGIVKCSVRSVDNIDAAEMIMSLKQSGLIINGGGHKMAGGLSFKESNLQAILDLIRSKYKALGDSYQVEKTIFYDHELPFSSINNKLATDLRLLEPFGNCNSKPIFLIKGIKVSYYQILQDKYLKVVLSDGLQSKNAICFNAFEQNMFTCLTQPNANLSLLVNITINRFQEQDLLSIQILDCYI